MLSPQQREELKKRIQERKQGVSSTSQPTMQQTSQPSREDLRARIQERKQQQQPAQSSVMPQPAQLPNAVGFGEKVKGQFSGLGKGGFQTVRGLARTGQEILDQTAGRFTNLVTGKGFTPTNTAQETAQGGGIFGKDFGEYIKPKNTSEQTGIQVEKIAEFLAPSSIINKATQGLALGGRVLARTLPDIATSYVQSKGAEQTGKETAINTGVTGIASAAANALLPGKPASIASTLLRSAGAGEVSDIATGLAGYRGEDRTGIKSVIPGAGFLISTGLGAFQTAPQIKQQLTTPKNQRVAQDIITEFEKGVKPNLPGKTTPTSRSQFNNKIVEGVSVINNNKAGLQFTDEAGEIVTGRAPKTLKEFSDAIEQTKARVYSEYDTLATQAGKNGVQVETLPIANELDEVINNKALQLSHPEAVRYAQEVQSRFRKVGALDAKTAQDVIKNYNNSLQAFYRNPTPEGLTRNAVDAMMVNRIRKALDDGIEGLTGAQYQSLKNQYGALKTIERDVMRATLRDARKNMKGLIDYTDIFSGGQIVNGILSMNPATIASGMTQKAISSYFKYLNNPSRAIEKMFNMADSITTPKPTIPLSTRKLLPAPKPGTPNVQVDVPIRLGSRTQSTVDAQEMARLQNQSNQLPANNLRPTSPSASATTNVSKNGMSTVIPQPQGKTSSLSPTKPSPVSSPKSTTLGSKVKDAGKKFMEDMKNEDGKISFGADRKPSGMDLANLKDASRVKLPAGQDYMYIDISRVPQPIKNAFQLLISKKLPTSITIKQMKDIKALAEEQVFKNTNTLQVKSL